MADTYEVSINNTAWTDVSQGNDSGFLTNRSDAVVYFRQADPIPAPTVLKGHKLNPTADSVNFVVVAPDRVYARSTVGPAIIVVTP